MPFILKMMKKKVLNVGRLADMAVLVKEEVMLVAAAFVLHQLLQPYHPQWTQMPKWFCITRSGWRSNSGWRCKSA